VNARIYRYLEDINACTLAEFITLPDSRIIPAVPLFLRYLTNQSDPLWFAPGISWDAGGFLRYLATIAAEPPHGLPYQLRRHAGIADQCLQLTPHMEASVLAEATDLDVELVRSVLADHLVFRES